MTTKMSSDNLNTDRCPKCGVLMTDCTDYQSENERMRAMLRRMVDEFEFSSDRTNGTLSEGRQRLLVEARDAYQQPTGAKK